MSTYLLAWNPSRWEWQDLDLLVESVQAGESIVEPWSCGNNQSISEGDRIFLIRLGEEPRGIIASGDVIKGSYRDIHWDPKLATEGKFANFVDVRIEFIVNPSTQRIISRDELSSPEFSKMHWDTQISGISIPNEIAAALEQRWAILIFSYGFHLPEEIIASKYLPEGAKRKVTINSYERNPRARRASIDHYGPICEVCGMNFRSTYGAVAEGFIHVHHLVPVSDIGEVYKVDPIIDLRPVCPNCHAVIHLKQPPYSIHEVKEFLKTSD